MPTTTIETIFSSDGLQARLREQTDEAGHYKAFVVALPQGRAERSLSEAHLLVQTFGDTFGAVPTHVREHYEEGLGGRSRCPSCKLLGKVLSAQGRRAPSEFEMRKAQIVLPGVTSEGLAKAERDRAARAAYREARQIRLAKGAENAKVDDYF